MTFPGWVTDALGEPAAELRDAVLVAIPRAHKDAVAAQAASGTRKRDPYGHTMKNRQHECLVEVGGLVDGVEVIRPHGASFELLQVSATKTVLFPWRYATSSRVTRVDARMRTSSFRRDLLSTGEPTAQLTLEHAGLSDKELEAQLTEDEAIVDELRRFATVVTVAYASNPTGLLDLGWGVAELLDDRGAVDWKHWEPLPWLASARSSSGGQAPAGVASPLRPAPTAETGDRVPERFDQSAPLVDDFGLTPRSPLAGEPSCEVAPEVDESGTEENQR